MDRLEKLFQMSFKSLYELYLKKAERKSRTKAEVDALLCWLTGHNIMSLEEAITTDSVRDFLENAPQKNTARETITGSICGVKIQEIEDPLMKEIRIMDKVMDELAKGKTLEKIMYR